MKGATFKRFERGYFSLGLSWTFNPFGRTILVGFGWWSLMIHWQTRANKKLLADARRDMEEKVEGGDAHIG